VIKVQKRKSPKGAFSGSTVVAGWFPVKEYALNGKERDLQEKALVKEWRDVSISKRS